MVNQFMRSIEKYIPEKILNDSSISMEDQVNCRVFVCVMLFTFCLSVLLAIFFLIAQMVSSQNFTNTIIAGVGSGMTIGFIYLFFYKTGYVHASTSLFSTMIFIVSVVSIVLSKGPLSTSMPILIACPVIAAAIGGRHELLYMGAIVMVVGGILVTLEELGFKLYLSSADENYNILFFSSWTITIVLSVSSLYVNLYMKEIGISGDCQKLRG